VRGRIGRGTSGDRGAAVVEFVMIAALLMFLLFAVMQVAVYFYVRNIVAAAAADGSRHAASSGVAVDAGGAYADAAVERRLSPTIGHAIPCSGAAERDSASGLPLAVVRCSGHVRSIFFPLGAMLSIDVTSGSLKEGVP
jgi:Flp pilus assembly protein TadG